MNKRTTPRPPVPWHGGPRDRDLVGIHEETDHIGPNRLPVLILRTDEGDLRSVACWGTSRRQAEAVQPGDRVRIHEASTGFRTITIEVAA